jgi:prepilin-type N-terminal cleavage/methylation domain-containing protein/prepilin-type processing-associated H-X9-DG protein
MRQRRGFTLVELLVVIGIIALLISILMPSLSRARASASLVSCQSNFKQIYMALSFYSLENKGLLPYASHVHPTDLGNNYDNEPSGTNARTFIELSRLLGSDIKDVYRDPLNKVFLCTEAETNPAVAWCLPMMRTIHFHPRAMPGYDQIQADRNKGPGAKQDWPQRRLSSIKNSAEKVAFWEGPQLPTWNGTTEPEALMLDDWRYSYGHRFRDEIPAGSGDSWDNNRRKEPIRIGANRDDGWFVCAIRFRHMKNTSTPVGFWDGHVESRTLKIAPDGTPEPDIRVDEFRISY